jgi:DNA mismatch repair protein MutL
MLPTKCCWEVVQRPASVVKELLENAVDAKATDIKLVIKMLEKHWFRLLTMVWECVTMRDCVLSVMRHQKIRQAEDLFSLHTKGFRGEALASIAAIAHVEMKTKQDQERNANYC